MCTFQGQLRDLKYSGNVCGSSINIFMTGTGTGTGTGTNYVSSELPKITAMKIVLLLGCQQEVG